VANYFFQVHPNGRKISTVRIDISRTGRPGRRDLTAVAARSGTGATVGAAAMGYSVKAGPHLEISERNRVRRKCLFNDRISLKSAISLAAHVFQRNPAAPALQV